MHAIFILYVADQAASTRFYRHVLAAEPILDVPGMTEFELSDGAILGLMPIAGARRLLGASSIADVDPSAARAELYLSVAEPERMLERAVDAAAVLLSAMAPRPWGDRAAYVMDPDGHVLAISSLATDRPEVPTSDQHPG